MTRPEMAEWCGTINTMFNHYNFRSGEEIVVQDQIEEIFKSHGLPCIREMRLNATERPDFVIANGLRDGDVTFPLIAVEVKVDGSGNSILRQVKRYTDHPRIVGVILVSVKPLVMPLTLSEKPVCNIPLWRFML